MVITNGEIAMDHITTTLSHPFYELHDLTYAYQQACEKGEGEQFLEMYDLVDDAARAVLLKLIQDRNAELLNSNNPLNRGIFQSIKSASELAAFQNQCQADWERFSSGVAQQAKLPIGVSKVAAYYRHIAAWVVVNKPYRPLTLSDALVRSWDSTGALVDIINPETIGAGQKVTFSARDQLMVRYFHAYCGMEQPDFSSFTLEDLRSLKGSVWKIIEAERQLQDYGILNTQSTQEVIKKGFAQSFQETFKPEPEPDPAADTWYSLIEAIALPFHLAHLLWFLGAKLLRKDSGGGQQQRGS